MRAESSDPAAAAVGSLGATRFDPSSGAATVPSSRKDAAEKQSQGTPLASPRKSRPPAHGDPIEWLNGVPIRHNIERLSARGHYGYHWQCVEFIRRYYIEYYGFDPGPAFDACRHLFRTGMIPHIAGMTSIPPRAGDILVNYRWSGGAPRTPGHVGIVGSVILKGARCQVTIFQQNKPPYQKYTQELHKGEDGHWARGARFGGSGPSVLDAWVTPGGFLSSPSPEQHPQPAPDLAAAKVRSNDLERRVAVEPGSKLEGGWVVRSIGRQTLPPSVGAYRKRGNGSLDRHALRNGYVRSIMRWNPRQRVLVVLGTLNLAKGAAPNSPRMTLTTGEYRPIDGGWVLS